MGYTQLTKIERDQIQSFLKAVYTRKVLAQELVRNPRTISRETSCNAGLSGYGPQKAQRLASERRYHTIRRITEV